MMRQPKHQRSDLMPHARHEEAQRALDRALQLHDIPRMERLVSLTSEYPDHGPTWLALAEEHAAASRNEEAAGALWRALKIDPSLRHDVSRKLRDAARDVIDAGASLSDPAAPSASPSASTAPAGRYTGPDARASEALDQAMRLPAEQRCDRLAELALRHPGHGPTWLALAEEHLAGSHVEYAVSAYERALTIDPALRAVASRKLEALHRYHRQVRLDHLPAKVERTVPPSSWMTARRLRPTQQRSVPRPGRIRARGTTPPPMDVPDIPAQLEEPVPGISESSVHEALGSALERPERDQRLAALHDLERRAPDAPPVLFHLALELALAGRHGEARRVGDRLMQVSPAYYRRLYEVAERHWPAADKPRLAGVGARSVQPTKMMDVRNQLAASPEPAPLPPQRTQVLPEAHVPAATHYYPVASHHILPSQPALAAAPGHPDAMMSLPAPQPQPAALSSMRTIGFLAAGVFLGVLLVVLLSWLMPRDHETVAPRAQHTSTAVATTTPAADLPAPSDTAR